MGKAKDYVDKVRAANDKAKATQDALESYDGDGYPDKLNKENWDAIQARNNAIKGR